MYKKSADDVGNNSIIWMKNLPSKRKNFNRKLPKIENFSNFSRMLKRIDILGCNQTLIDTEKSNSI